MTAAIHPAASTPLIHVLECGKQLPGNNGLPQYDDTTFLAVGELFSSMERVNFSQPVASEYEGSQQKRDITSKNTSKASPVGHSLMTTSLT
jgi:hypothetical protein